MGPRETKLVSTVAHASCKKECRFIRQARLADALEEALAFWDDAGVSESNAEHYDRLRAVLAEVDRG